MKPNTLRKLHLGCGGKKLNDWINIDSVKEFKPDIIHDISFPLPFDDLTVDEILVEDLLEHFDKYMRFTVFYQWVRVLKVGGIITIQVPNFRKILFRYFKFGFNNFVDMTFGENMLASEVYVGHFGNYKWGYSVKTLKEFITLFGLEPIKIDCKGLNIWLTAKKKHHISQEDLDDIKIYSHSNATGKGKAYLLLEFVKEKIKKFQDGIRD